MSEAEGVAKCAEEELAVAKERLLLQEDELQSRAGNSVCHPPGMFLVKVSKIIILIFLFCTIIIFVLICKSVGP